MVFDLIGYSEAAPGTGTVGVAGGLGDTLYSVNGDDIICKKLLKYLVGVFYGAEASPGYLRIDQPSFDKLKEFIRVNDIESVSNNPYIEDLREMPITLHADEKINAYSNNAGDEDTLVGLWVADGIMQEKPFMRIDEIIRGTCDQTLTANTWTPGAVTWSQDMKGGTWSIIGLKAGIYKSANAGLSLVRLTGLKGGRRPGVLANLTIGDKLSMIDTGARLPFSRWGVMEGVEFDHNSPPNIEVLSPYANTDIVLEMMLTKKS